MKWVAAPPLTLDLVLDLYRKHARDLERVRDQQRRLHGWRGDVHAEQWAAYRLLAATLGALGLPAHWKRRLKPQLDDLEAEITYLLVRELRPRSAVELGADRGWSTTWILQALRDNGAGKLTSYDLRDYCTRAVPAELATGRWTFVAGDVTRMLDSMVVGIDFLFIDAAHTAAFAHWYLEQVLPALRPGTPLAIHDIFPPPDKLERWGESGVVREWLSARAVPHLTVAPTAAPEAHQRLLALKHELGLARPIQWTQANPMVFLRAP